MPLSDVTVRKAKGADKPYRLSDEKALYLQVEPNDSKYWRMNYRFDGKQKTLALGAYPDVTLKVARERRDEARRLMTDGIDPAAAKAAAKASKAGSAANSFEVIAREWYAKHADSWVPSHGNKIIRRLERDVFPWIGGKPVDSLLAQDILKPLRRIEARGAIETTHRALQNIGQVMRYAVATGRAARDPTGDLRGALSPVVEAHFAAVTDPAEIGGLLRAMDDYKGGDVVRLALKLIPLVFVRPGELRRARWGDVDLDGAEWRFVASKTKTDHIVPLSTQAVAVLRDLHALTGDGDLLFPSVRTKARPMSENTVNAALKRMGIDGDTMTGHGFRAMARTVLDEVHQVPIHIIEQQLAHAVKDANGRAYNRTAHLPQRKAMMQRWADYLDELREGAKILPFERKAG
jgi:integrase